MKRNDIIMLAVFLLLIPLTLYFGGKLPGRGYYITGILIILELLLPLFVRFGHRRVGTKDLVIIAVMSAIAVIGRVAIPIPNFKAAFALIMLTGIALGPETGFIVGAVTAFVSNFFYGQGAYMPWQMTAYGAGGMLAGFVFRGDRIPRKPAVMAVYGFFSVILWIGPMLDGAHLLLMMPDQSMASVMSAVISGFPVNLSQGICTALIMLVFGKPLLEKLDRVRQKYGMTED